MESFEREIIRVNLTRLLQDTLVTNTLLAFHVERRILSKEDREKLVS